MENKKEMETNPNKDQSQKSKWWKVVKTVFLVLVWVCLGLYLEIIGPTLIDLKIRTQSSYEDVATAVSGRSVGRFIGSALGGVVVDKLKLFCDLMIAVSLDGGAVATLGVPWVPRTELIWFLTCLQGSFEGVINIAGQKLIIDMWREDASSPLHILHGGIGIGSFIIALIANPFLAVPANKDGNKTEFTNTSYEVATNSRVITSLETTTSNDDYVKPSRIEYAYLTAAVITASLSIVFYVYHFLDRGMRTVRVKEMAKSEKEGKNITIKEMLNPATCTGGRFLHGLQIFTLLFLYFFMCVGGERVGGKFIRAFSIDYYGFSTDDGSYINTCFWVSFAIGRFVGFFTARWIPIRILILLETGGVLVTCIFLVIFGGSSPTALWVLMQSAGFFIAPLFPTGLGWGNYHVEVTGMAITSFLFGGSLGGVVFMKLIGYLYDRYGPKTFLYTLLGYSIAVFLFAVFLDITGAQNGRFSKGDDNAMKTVELKKGTSDDEKGVNRNFSL